MRTAPCRAMWWPIAPYEHLAVSTEDAGVGWQTSKVELWQRLGGKDKHHISYNICDKGVLIMYYIILYYIIFYFIILYYTILYCIVLYCIILSYIILLYVYYISIILCIYIYIYIICFFIAIIILYYVILG